MMPPWEAGQGVSGGSARSAFRAAEVCWKVKITESTVCICMYVYLCIQKWRYFSIGLHLCDWGISTSNISTSMCEWYLVLVIFLHSICSIPSTLASPQLKVSWFPYWQKMQLVDTWRTWTSDGERETAREGEITDETRGECPCWEDV